MRLYHGTDKLNLEYLDSIKSKKDNDFGIGLYVTNDREQAKKWAKIKGKNARIGAVYESEIDLSSLKILEYAKGEEDYNYLCYLCRYEVEEIAKETIANFENADVICGPMIGYAEDFKNDINVFHGEKEDESFLKMKDKVKVINYNVKSDIPTFEDLERRIKSYGNQYCLKSNMAKEMFNEGIKRVTYIDVITGKTINTQLLEYDKKQKKLNICE